MKRQVCLGQNAAVGRLVGGDVIENFDELRDDTNYQKPLAKLLQRPLPNSQITENYDSNGDGDDDQVLGSEKTVHKIPRFFLFQQNTTFTRNPSTDLRKS
jgi:hypothetical protein